jgi:hypothetical protein
MHDLQLVGFTTDRRGLIFRTRAGARSEASFVVPVTAELIELVGEIAAEQHGDGPREPDRDDAGAIEAATGAAPDAPASRPRSQLSVRDIQARLRAGEATSRVAAEAGVDEEWIERFAPPVRAEQQRIVARALECHLHRARSAPSGVPLRRAVGMALADKGIAYTVAAYEAAWAARLLGHDRWAVTFTYHHRGRERVATWTYDAAEDTLTTTDRVAAQLGYVTPGRAGDDDGEEIDGVVGDASAVAASSTVPPPPPATRRTSTTTKAGSKAAAKRPGRTRATAGTEAATKKASAAKKAKKKKTSAAKRTAAKKTSVAKKPSAKKTSVAKKAVAKKAVAKEPVAKTPATRKAPPVTKTSPAAKEAPPVAEDALVEPTPPVVDEVVDAPPARRLPDELPRPAEVSIATAPLAGRPPTPATPPAENGRRDGARPAPADRTPPHRDADEVDPAAARRARAAQRNAPTVQFRSGSAAPVRLAAAREPVDPERPETEGDRPGPTPGETNGAARPATRRRRQLRAR